MFILHPNLDEGARRFFSSNYGLEITTLPGRNVLPVTAFHQWHRIVGDFNFGTGINLFSRPATAINLGRNNSPLINTEVAPLIIENNDIFINIDFSVSGQNLLTHPAFPIVVYRSFSWISQFEGEMNNYSIGDGFRHRQGALRSPSGEEFDASLTGFRFFEPGIWTHVDGVGNRSFLAVNMFDFENQSRHNPMSETDIENVSFLGTDYINKVLSQDMGNEIWKALLWAALLFLITEMIMVLLLQRKARV